MRELELVVKRAEETFDRNVCMKLAEEVAAAAALDDDDSSRPARKKRVEFEDLKAASESNFLNRLRIRKRSLKLLSFLGSKSQDSSGSKAQEERAARLLKMYMPEKSTAAGASSTASSSGPNTITIHHTSRDRRFWRLRNRRRSSST